MTVVQADWGGRYIGNMWLDFNDNGDLVSFYGKPVLMGDYASQNYVPEDQGVKDEVYKWKYW